MTKPGHSYARREARPGLHAIDQKDVEKIVREEVKKKIDEEMEKRRREEPPKPKDEPPPKPKMGGGSIPIKM